MAAAGGVGVGKFINQGEAGSAREQRVEVHLFEPPTLVFQPLARQHLETLEQGFGFFSAVRLDDRRNDILAVFEPRAGLLEHLIGFANSRRRANKDLQAAGAAVLPVHHGKQRIWRGALSWLTPLVSHAAEILAGSQLPASH